LGGRQRASIWKVHESLGFQEWSQVWTWSVGEEVLARQAGTLNHPQPRVGPTQSNKTWTKKSMTRRGLIAGGQVGSKVLKELNPSSQ